MSDPKTHVSREDYRHFYPMVTRWMDNDLYGHVNNVNYYSFFDSAVNRYLIEVGGLDIHQSEIVAFVVHSSCHYQQPIAYPEVIAVGIKVNKLGTSSVQYGVAIFKEGEDQACAFGEFVHVFVHRKQQRAVPIPEPLRKALQRLSAD